tara:strand:- start:28 stop:1233 length:1206 start_codon:yes stop_codon:yes gene_type:complete
MKKVCKSCLYNEDHPLGIIINEEGICSGCLIHKEKYTLDWKERWNKLQKIVKEYKSNDKRNYDCIIPVTGANDSYFTVYIAKEKLGLNPLLVTHNRYYNTPLGIRNLSNLRIKFNCDIIIQNININSIKKLSKATLYRLGSFHWPVIAGQTVFPVRTAVNHRIPLIIWGAHQGVEQVGMFSHLHEVEMTRRYRKDHDLMGIEANQLVNSFDLVKEEDVHQLIYPSEVDIEKVGVRGIYLSNYLKWDPLQQHILMTKKYGYKTAKCQRTFDVYDHVDCWHFMGIHDHIKYLKNGYSKVLDHACREIRHGRISRNHALKLVDFYTHQDPKYNDLLFEWLGIKKSSFEYVIKKHAKYGYENKIDLNTPELSINTLIKKIGFNSSLNINYDKKDKKYILFGKGYP